MAYDAAYYASQARAVKSVARSQRRAAKRRRPGFQSGESARAYATARRAAPRKAAKFRRMYTAPPQQPSYVARPSPGLPRRVATRARQVEQRERRERQVRVQRRERQRKGAARQERKRKVAIARAQERSYVSLGKAVQSQADVQKAGYDPKFARRAVQTGLLKPQTVRQSRLKYLRAKNAKKPGLKVSDVLAPVNLAFNPSLKAKGEALKSEAPAIRAVMGVTKGARKEIKKKTLAPAVWALDQTMRANYAIASAAKKDVQEFKKHGVSGIVGHGSLQAAGKGAQLKDRTTFSDVLKEAGVKNKAVAGVAGFILDVGLDPTTYVTFGASSPARVALAKSAQKSARAAERAALKAGKSKAEARAIYRDTGKRALQAGKKQTPTKSQTKGIDVKFAGKRVPGVVPATVALRRGGRSLGKPLRPVTQSAAAGEVRKAGRNLAASVNAQVRPAHIAKSEKPTVKALQREARATGSAGTRRITDRVNATLDALAPAERDAVIDAIEARSFKSLREAEPLPAPRARVAGKEIRRPVKARRTREIRRDPDRLVKVARQLDADLRYLRRTGRRAGTLTGDIGSQSRTRAEALLTSRATPVRSTQKVERRLAETRKEIPAVRARLRAAKTPAEQQAARADLDAVQGRMKDLKKQIAGTQRQQRISRAAAHGAKTLKQRRQAVEGRGYYPRPDVEDVARPAGVRGLIQDLSRAGSSDDIDVIRESVGANKPTYGGAKRRETRGTRAQLRETPEGRDYLAGRSANPQADVGRQGAKAIKAATGAELNTKMVQQMGEKLPKRGVSAQHMRDLQAEGKSVYRVRGGHLEKMDPTSWRTVDKVAKGGATKSGGQYAVLRDDVVKEVRNAQATIGAENPALRTFDWAQGGFKSLALATPGYLVRNLTGDMWNAFLHENPVRLVRNMNRGRKALDALGRYEKAGRKFGEQVPEGHEDGQAV